MEITKTAKSYIEELSDEEFAKVSQLKDFSAYYLYLAEPHRDAVKAAGLAIECARLGIPEEYSNSSESLHYLAVAINSRLNGNA